MQGFRYSDCREKTGPAVDVGVGRRVVRVDVERTVVPAIVPVPAGIHRQAAYLDPMRFLCFTS